MYHKILLFICYIELNTNDQLIYIYVVITQSINISNDKAESYEKIISVKLLVIVINNYSFQGLS